MSVRNAISPESPESTKQDRNRKLSARRPCCPTTVSVFVWSGATAEMKVNSHFEKLAQSRCKIESGERLWCGSCHDPHSLPAEAEKAAYFRQKCVTCHASNAACKASPAVRARNGDNCIECHMPKNPVIDVAHAVYTDHSIPRRRRARL